MPNLDPDFDNVLHPAQAVDFLRQCASECMDSAEELSSAWQDNSAGKPWLQLARILLIAAGKCDKTFG